MSTLTIVKPMESPALERSPSEDEIRAYASHLYEQNGSLDGHDTENWLEAEACLRAGIPKASTRPHVHHHHTQITARESLPVKKHGKS